MTLLAYDRTGSVRSFDDNGRLRVERTPISKANICIYQGREIPDHVRLGLKPDQPYRLLRDPKELEKAADTFNSLPILEEHVPTSADAVYRYALQQSGMAADSLAEINQAGLRALVQTRLTSMTSPAPHMLATDSASTGYTAPRRY